jgi:hypothetical protein
VDDHEILGRIRELVNEEHDLRGGNAPADERELQQLEEALDQCWDLLRQRRARREQGEDPDEASARATDTVEHYQQ